MDIDVIIPVYKPGRQLLRLLDQLEKQTLVPQTILLANTEESYFEEAFGNMPFFERYPNVEVFHVTKQQFDHGGTRRLAVRRTQAPVFVMLTQDAVPEDRFLLERLTRPLFAESSPRIAVTYGRQLPGRGSSTLEECSRAFNYPEESRTKTRADLSELGIKTFFCSDVCAAYPRDIYDSLGGFVRRTIFNEDMIYAAAAIVAGYAVRYEASARVIHSHNYTNMQQLRRNFDLGVSQAEHPEVFRMTSSEAEGKRLVTETTERLLHSGKFYRLPSFYLQCASKYLGYLLGKHYKCLPKSVILKLTTNRAYWEAAGEV
jgi:rhamnosyltransferase